MTIERRQVLAGSAGAALVAAWPGRVSAQSRAETLRYVTGNTVNTLDPCVPGATREAFGLSMNVYDRLVTFGRKQVGGNWVFDHASIRPELAQSYTVSPDGLTITFALRQDATWHDGSPVTAEDIKWSLDRAVSAKSLAPPQLSTGSLVSPDQFRVADPHTVVVTLARPDRLALSNLCTVYAIMINSTLARQHATADDPWALGWLRENTAASGAYMVETNRPGEQVVLRRHDAWKGGAGGALPFMRRVIVQTVPDVSTRANLIERGDADLAIDLAASDIPAMEKAGRAKVVSVPQSNGFTHISVNTQRAPFDNPKVRQALAAALPYEDMFKAALFGRGRKLFGADWAGSPPTAAFPQAMPSRTDPARAKQLLADAGMAGGFSTSFAFATSQAPTAEPMAALVKEALGRVGIQVDIQKIPDAQFNTAEAQKTLAFYTDGATAWLPFTDYYFRLYFTRDQRWNFASFENKEMNALTADAQFQLDQAKYDAECKQMIAIFADLDPLILLWQPNHDAVMAASIDGYTYQFYRQADFRDLRRT